MNQGLLSVNAVTERIAKGASLMLAGDESLMVQLPKGNWIGGTIPYFMTKDGGLQSRDQLFVTELSEGVTIEAIKRYDESNLANVYSDLPAGAFGVIIIPASSPEHLSFALNAPMYNGFATKPLAGWIAGAHLDDLETASAKIFDGITGTATESGAVVLQAKPPAGVIPEVNIVNIFSQGEGDVITFPKSGFEVTDAYINGQKCNFAEYAAQKNLNTQLPLVADSYGAMINISFQEVLESEGLVKLYAPVFPGIRYRHAAPVGDYVEEFSAKTPKENNVEIAFSCNCILNYLHSELEGKKTGKFVGPITFGEIAYQLLNQTMVYISLNRV